MVAIAKSHNSEDLPSDYRGDRRTYRRTEYYVRCLETLIRIHGAHAYASEVGQRRVHISEEEISELDAIKSRKEESPLVGLEMNYRQG
jgi:hypothetical protein